MNESLLNFHRAADVKILCLYPIGIFLLNKQIDDDWKKIIENLY